MDDHVGFPTVQLNEITSKLQATSSKPDHLKNEATQDEVFAVLKPLV